MFLEYFSADVHHGPVVLLGNVSPSDAAILTTALRALASGAANKLVLEDLPGMQCGSRLVSFVAHGVDWDGGCRASPGTNGHFQCALKRLTWDQVAGLLEPFETPHGSHAHQYLSEEGPVAWIVSNDSTW